MSESSAQVIQGGVDPQSALLHNIRQLSGAMEIAQTAGHEGLAGGLSGVRSDLMNMAGMSSGYDPRNSSQVKSDFFEQGPQRMQALIEQAGGIQSADGLGSALQSRIAGVGASLTSAGHMRKPELDRGQEAGVDKAHSQANSVIGKLTAALQNGHAAGENAAATRWQDVATKRPGGEISR